MTSLYQIRTFGQLLNDTIAFFKSDGKNFFKVFFTVLGIPLVLIGVSIYFLMTVFFEGIFGVARLGGTFSPFSSFYENIALFVGLGLVSIIGTIFLSIFHFCYPIIYFHFKEQGKEKPEVNDIMKFMKQSWKRILVVFILLFLMIIPLALVYVGVMMASILSIFLFPVMLLLYPAFFCWFMLSLHHYLMQKSSLTDAFQTAWNYLKNGFWKNVFSTIISYVLVQVMVTVITMIPYIFLFISIFAGMNEVGVQDNRFSYIGIIFTIVILVAIISSYVFGNFMVVNQSYIYFSEKEAAENTSTKSDIDLIGTHEA